MAVGAAYGDSEALWLGMGVEGRSAREIMGSPDDLKLRSCATLFSLVSHPGSIFHKLLDMYYGGERCSRTLEVVVG